MSAWDSPIIRVSTGQLNSVDDALIGGVSGGSGGFSKYAGQLGKRLVVDQSQIGLLSDAAVGTLYGGVYQYVRLSEDADAPVVGEVAFWDLTEPYGAYQVTDDPSQGATDGTTLAGVFINAITPGNYGFVQVLGVASVLYTNPVTASGIGNPVVVVASGSPAGVALVDQVSSVSNPSLLLGWGITAGVAETLGLIQLNPLAVRV